MRTPRTRSHGDQETFQSFSCLTVPPLFGCTRLGSVDRGPPTSWICGPIQRGRGTTGPRVAHLLTHPPSSLSPSPVQPWDPRLLRLQGCDGSPAHPGLGGIRCPFFSCLLFSKLIFIVYWNAVNLQCLVSFQCTVTCFNIQIYIFFLRQFSIYAITVLSRIPYAIL